MRRVLLPLAAPLLPLLLVAWLWPRGDFYLGGIQVNEPDHAAWLAALDDARMNTVAVTVYARQADWDGDNLWWDAENPWVVSEIRSAKKRGLEVVLVLRLALDHAYPRNRFLWHGMAMPATDALLDSWFTRYREFALQWARIAETWGVDVLGVASELNALTSTVEVDELPALEEYWTNEEKVERETARVLAHAPDLGGRRLPVRGSEGYSDLDAYLDDQAAAHGAWARQVTFDGAPDALERFNARRRDLERRWEALIAEVRDVYHGRLTYAANFDQYEFVTFWGRLDLLGVNAYFPLRRRLLPGATPGELSAHLEARWRAILRGLDAFRREQGVPEQRVLFTELGYVRRANSTIEPWAATGFSVLPSPDGPQAVVWEAQPPDLRERALAVRALYDAHLDVGGDLLAGILYWKLSTVLSHRDVEPFVLLLNERPPDPLLAEMVRFRERLPFERMLRRMVPWN